MTCLFFRCIRQGLLVAGALVPVWVHAAIAIEHWVEPSGARVYLVSSPGIPMVDVQLDFDGGARRDPAHQAGLASATANVMSAGVDAWQGQPARDENALAEAWLDTGAQTGASASAERFSLSLRSLTDPAWLPQAVALAAQQIAAPSFPDGVWQRDRERQIAALREAENRPATHANRAFAKAVYRDHPYGRETRAETLRAITVADMRGHYQRTVQACRAVVTVVGAVDKAGALAIVQPLVQAMGIRARP